jgi:hypothetical protein
MLDITSHSAEKVQSDINTFLEALTQFLSKIQYPINIPTQQEAPPVLEMDAWLAEEEPFTDIEITPERNMLSGSNPPLLEGREPLLVLGSPTPPQLEAGAEIHLQIEGTYIIALLPDLKSQLEQLSPEQLALLTQAIERPALQSTELIEVVDGELIDIEIDGVQCFHQEQGQVTVNALLPNASQVQSLEGIESEDAVVPTESSVNIDVQRVHDITLVTQIGEKVEEPATVELRPAHEVESLTGQAMGDSSTLHEQVLQDAAPVRVMRDQYGHIKGGAGVRASVEVTEDVVEAEAEYQAEHQPLTPQAKEVVEEIHGYFDRTGEQKLPGNNDYLIEKLDNDRLQFIPYHSSDEAIIINREQVESTVDLTQYQHLMIRFAEAYESIRTAEQSRDRELELT